jgi:predicted transcriptional regulator
MDRKQKESLVLALAEKGKTYREITREAGVSPNTIKLVLNKAGLDQNTSLASRVFEFYSQQKTPSPLEAAIKLGLESDKAIQYHQEYFMLLGCTEFTKVYPLIKNNPYPFVNHVKLVLNSGMGDGEVVELLKIANGHLPLVRLEYDRTKAELNSTKADLDNVVRTYQQFVDSNIALKKRENELQQTINELEAKKAVLEKTATELQHSAEIQENNVYNDYFNLIPEVKQEDFISTNDVFIPLPNMAINYHQNEDENKMHTQVEPLSRPLIFDSRDIFRYQQE